VHVYRCNRLNYRTASMRCSVSHTRNAKVSRTCDKQTSTTTNVVDVKWAVSVINKLGLPPTLLVTPRIPPPAHRRGRGPAWRMDTNFGGMVSELETCRQVEQELIRTCDSEREIFTISHTYFKTPKKRTYFV